MQRVAVAVNVGSLVDSVQLQLVKILWKTWVSQNSTPSTYLELQTTSFLWLFQLDDSKSLHKKWVFHQTSIKISLFRVPGTQYCPLSGTPEKIQYSWEIFGAKRYTIKFNIETKNCHIYIKGVNFCKTHHLGVSMLLFGGVLWQLWLAPSYMKSWLLKNGSLILKGGFQVPLW